MAYTQYEVRGNAGILTFNKPEELNALSRPGIEEVTRVISDLPGRLAGEPGVRALVLTGAGRAFIAGANIKEMREMDAQAAREFSRAGNRMLRLIESFPLPVIAAVNGFALGGGLETALSADFIYAAKTAKFGLPEVTLGLIPGFGGTKRLLQRVGNARARELVLTARIIDAEEAFRLGIVNRVVDPDALLDAALATAAELAKTSPNGVRNAKALLDQCAETAWDSVIEREAARFGDLFAHPEAAEGLSAFVQKRKPAWAPQPPPKPPV
ncbi:MAG: enoyl-CoA hydratase-related protein [Verrucomicrobiota bacterium]|nr:enoyl-CoA hydratase-related protein [Verrucomicrobiota bacterium]